ncbi:MAG: hypothetical protein WCG29_14215 [Desulfomonile sp.]|jgi:hypothetical protein
MSKPKWEKEMEEYINGMTAEEFRDFLQDTGYEFYKNVKTSFLGLIGLESSKEVSLPCYIRPDEPVGIIFANYFNADFGSPVLTGNVAQIQIETDKNLHYDLPLAA